MLQLLSGVKTRGFKPSLPGLVGDFLHRAGLSSEAAAPVDKNNEDEESDAAAAALRRAKQSEKRKAKQQAKQQDPLEPPPPPSEFPKWAYDKRDYFSYEIVYKSKNSNARVGRIHTPHGIINTPGFVSVATNGAIKAVDHRAADDAGCELMFMNTYHLLLQPGPDVIDKMGGLHKFANRSRPIITDSGGFQVLIYLLSSRVPILTPEELRARSFRCRTGLKLIVYEALSYYCIRP